MVYIFYAFLAYLLYLFVFRVVIPVYRTTRQVRRSFRDIQDRMQQPRHEPRGAAKPDNIKKPKGDYIDFEEIK